MFTTSQDQSSNQIKKKTLLHYLDTNSDLYLASILKLWVYMPAKRNKTTLNNKQIQDCHGIQQ